MMKLIKPTPKTDNREAFIAAMWMMFLRAPGRQTAPGEPMDLGEIGKVREKNWAEATPYSTAEVKLRRHIALASVR
jgi:hypothetical protein